jgi:asparagine synthase (glutamine-hydrolysing)
MCAIAGLLASRSDKLRFIRRMTGLMAHRGPDDEGLLLRGPQGIRTFRADDISNEARGDAAHRIPSEFTHDCPGAWLALGHRRLAILDLSPLGHQPMSYQGRYWIVYNGEVYNYLELRAELQKAGNQFHSQCDTEVILAAYAQWGTDCFSRFNGMWAMAIYDVQTDELVLSRDRFGIKPLYYWQQAGQLAFASEIKAFTCLPGWHPRVNGQAVHDFLLTGLQDHSAETLFADVLQLEPGCFARLDCARWTQRDAADTPLDIVRWYQVRPQHFGGTFQDAAQRFRELLVDAVRLRLRADVPVGSCLSGGLDSSSIVCITNELLSNQQTRCTHKTFSACSEFKRFDEREFIEQVIVATGAGKHFVFPSMKGLFSELDQVIWHQDEPFAGTSIYAQWCVFQSAAAAEIKVMLDGQGADELLCGYNDFHRAFLRGLVRSGRLLLAWQEALASRGNLQRTLGGFSRALLDALIPASAQVLFRRVRPSRPPPVWLDRSVLEAVFPGRLAGRFRRHQSARELSLELLTGAHLQMLLHWEDRNSMAHSLEARVPFLDYRLVEFAIGLPDHYKIREGVKKTVLREGLKGRVPAAVLQRRDKMGFVTPEEVWARESGGEIFRTRLAEAAAATKGIVRSDAAATLGASLAGSASYDSAIWRIICLGAWMRLFNVAV